jgi:3-oxoacyl-[acyl-carrier protein] reductase
LKALAKAAGRSLDEEIAVRSKLVPAGRVGEPEEFGAACAFLCSVQGGFIVGQNILLDGGLFNSTF